MLRSSNAVEVEELPRSPRLQGNAGKGALPKISFKMQKRVNKRTRRQYYNIQITQSGLKEAQLEAAEAARQAPSLTNGSRTKASNQQSTKEAGVRAAQSGKSRDRDAVLAIHQPLTSPYSLNQNRTLNFFTSEEQQSADGGRSGEAALGNSTRNRNVASAQIGRRRGDRNAQGTLQSAHFFGTHQTLDAE